MIKTNIKGITMMSLIIYIVVMLIAIGILATLNSSYKEGVIEMRAETTLESEYSKLNLYLLEEAKKTNNAIIDTNEEIITSYQGDTITFKSGNKFSWEDLDRDGIYSIYLEKGPNEKFEIAYNAVKSANESIFKVSSTDNGNTQVELTLFVNGMEKKSIYVLSNQTENGLENEIVYIN